MAPKRQRGESSQSSPPFDRKRFVSFVASQRYHKLLSAKKLIPERGLLPDPTDGVMAEMIRKRKWQTFVSQPGPAAVNVVKEFYANAKFAEGSLVFVRGKWVNVGRKALNAYYGLAKIQDSEYQEYTETELDYSDIIVKLCEPGTEWKSTTALEAVNFPHGKLSRYGKAWYGFICAKLVPTMHKTEVTKERAALLYCLIMKKSMDVGAIIRSSMDKAIDGTTSGGLPHPSLITDLCNRAGVQWDTEEVLQPPSAPIDHSVIARYKVWEGGISQPNGLGYTPHPDDPSAAGPSAAGPAAGHATGSALSPDFIAGWHRDSQRHTRQISLVAHQVERATRRMDQQNSRIAERQDVMHAYNVDCNMALAAMFAQMNPNATPVPFPPPPAWPPYPPPDLDAGEDEAADDD